MKRRRSWFDQVLDNLPIDSPDRIGTDRVLKQRGAFSELTTAALRHPSLTSLLNEACRIAAEACDAPYAKILEHRPDEGALVIVAEWGLGADVLGARAAADAGNPAGQCLVDGKPVVIPDLRQRNDYHLPPIYPQHRVIASANVPIVSSDSIYGVIEIDCTEEHTFDSVDLSFLASISILLGEGVERVRREQASQAALDARALLLREQQHRVRNNFQTVLMLLQKHALQASTEDSRRRFQDVQRRVLALASIYDHLLGVKLSGTIDLNGYLADLCDSIRQFHRLDEQRIELFFAKDDPLTLTIDTCTALGIVVNELVANAVEHAFGPEGGRITVCMRRDDDGKPTLIVEDNGVGFRDGENSSTGLAVSQRLVEQVGGTMRLRSKPGDSTWLITLPEGVGTP